MSDDTSRERRRAQRRVLFDRRRWVERRQALRSDQRDRRSLIPRRSGDDRRGAPEPETSSA